eukprot:TRINITY_DN24796_c0_g1_i3.p1 TRINITY_DN24796_c0_g1~~TRINITY_DN24796_c0_g1_i3.p1  ORF type:complete len:464 (+),score=35.73 TRINITY_DN24796_c0_g1_i3:447-1838(+)
MDDCGAGLHLPLHLLVWPDALLRCRLRAHEAWQLLRLDRLLSLRVACCRRVALHRFCPRRLHLARCPSADHGSWALEATLHCCVLVLHVGASYCMRTWTLIEVHQTLAAHNWRTERLAAEGLLNLLCDCVLELDSELCIVKESAKFASMILVREVGTIVGRTMHEFLVESSKSTLSNVLRSGAIAGALNMELVDTMRNTITVEMFYIQFSESAASQKRYFVGLREFGDISRIIRERPGGEPAVQPLAAHANMDRPPMSFTELSDASFALQTVSQVEAAVLAPGPSQEEQVVVRSNDVDASRVHDIIMRLTNKQPSKFRRCSDSVASKAASASTKPEAMEATLTQLIRSWMPGEVATESACCIYHAAIASVKAVALQLETKPCDQNFALIGQWQCVDCGFLTEQARADDECVVCNMCKHSEPSAVIPQHVQRDATAASDSSGFPGTSSVLHASRLQGTRPVMQL